MPTIAAGVVVPYDVVTGGHTIPRRVAALGAAAAATAAVGRERIGVGVTTGSGVVTLALRPGPSTDGFLGPAGSRSERGVQRGKRTRADPVKIFFDFFGVNKPCIMNQLHPNGGDRPRRGDL